MPTNAIDYYAVVHKHGTATFLARVIGSNGAAVTREQIASASYSVYLLDEEDADLRTVVIGHTALALTVADVMFDTLQTDAVWTKDAVGYNFKHTVAVDAHEPFTIAGRRYLLEYVLVPVTGERIIFRWIVTVI